MFCPKQRLDIMDAELNKEQMNRFPDIMDIEASLSRLSHSPMDFESHFIESVEGNPLGRLLKVIASLPEVRQEKVQTGRRWLEREDGELNDRLSVALDKLLEEILES